MLPKTFQDENFVKSQLNVKLFELVAFCKALSKTETPIKQKHVRALIVGTHKHHSARIFWHGVSRVQLEKNPVLTWKFCQILHKLIRDGHRKVLEDSFPNCNRLIQLENFWQHLRTSGYGQANTVYCKMLASRLRFHKKYSSIPGNLNLTANQLEALTADVNETYELAIDMLDQMDELLGLKTTVMNIMESFRWSSLIPQGQCLLAPLILLILDSSKFYDFLVKALFKLHSKISPDTLMGHRQRFYEIFQKTKKFYEKALCLQYFKYLVSIPSLPSTAPNFLQASDLDAYQTPQAYMRTEASSESGEATPPDSQSICEDTIIDFSNDDNEQLFEDNVSQSTSNIENNATNEIINTLHRDLEMERTNKKTLMEEARQRIEQYEARLIQMKAEIDKQKLAAETAQNELSLLQQKINEKLDNTSSETDQKIAEKEQKISKFKVIYEKLRQEHINTLIELRDIKEKAEKNEIIIKEKQEELLNIKETLATQATNEILDQKKTELNKNALSDANSRIQELESNLSASIKEIDLLKNTNKIKVEQLELQTQKNFEKKQLEMLNVVFIAGISILESGLEELQNATSISYPTHLIENSLRLLVNFFEYNLIDELKNLNKENFLNTKFVKNCIFFAHRIAYISVNCSAAAYSTSIQSFEINEQCRCILNSSISFFNFLQSVNDLTQLYNEAMVLNVKNEIEKLENLIKALPSVTNNDTDLNLIGSQLEVEMKRMDSAIKNAVEHIEQLQRSARENSTGIRLEVNDKILDACNNLMEAVRHLVSISRDVQEEIVTSGRGSTSSTEFYKRNHLWTEGLLSAASAVGVAATVLVNSADGVITGTSKFEQLIVAAQEIGASVAQLFVSSRVKADKSSQKLIKLGAASKNVNTCTAAVVAAAKSGQKTLSDEKLLDFSKLSLHDAKKEEMESQVRTLELEAELTRERSKLFALRKQHYHLASLVSNNNANNSIPNKS